MKRSDLVGQISSIDFIVQERLDLLGLARRKGILDRVPQSIGPDVADRCIFVAEAFPMNAQ